MLEDPESKRIYFTDGEALKINSLMKRPDLAKTISQIADQGLEGFYAGEVAALISKAMKDNQGFIDFNDLSNYRPNIQKPISTKYRGNTVYTCLLYTSDAADE